MNKDETIQALRDLNYDLIMDACRARDLLDPVITGSILMGRSPKGRVLSPSLRKTTLADARKMCAAAVHVINKATSEDKTRINCSGEPLSD